MDPVTAIAGAATAVAQTLFAVVNLIAFYRGVDHSLWALESLSKGLAQVLDHLAAALNDNDSVLNHPKNTSVWTSVHEAVESCKTPIAELNDHLAPLREASNGVAYKAWRAVRLRLKQDDIDRIVSDMKTHSINLQLALQTVNVIIAASIPGAIAADLDGRFDRLERMIGAIRPRIDAPDARGRLEADNNGLQGVAIDPNTRQLFLSATSIVSASEAGTVRSSSTDAPGVTSRSQQPAFEDFTLSTRAGTLMVGSEAQSLDEEHRAHINDWISHSLGDDVIAEEDGEETKPDEDFDEDFEFEFIVEIFETGMDAYNQERFREAQENLSYGLDQVKELSNKKREEIGLKSMQYHHALSCAAQSSLDEAESSFRNVIEKRDSREGDTQLHCLALYQLARLQLKASQGEASKAHTAAEHFDAAEKYCKQAISRMRREPSIGRNHPDCYSSIRLLSLILWARGLKIPARAHSKMLPEPLRIAEDHFDEQLALILENYNPGRFLPGTYSNCVDGPSVRTESPTAKESTRLASLSVSNTQAPPSVRPFSVPSTVEGTVKSEGVVTVSTLGTDVSALRLDNTAATAELIRKKGFHRPGQVNKGLYWAAKYGQLDVLDIMLQYPSADVNTRNPGRFRTKETLLRIAAMNGNYAICERLLSENAVIDIMIRGNTALDAAIDKGYVDICRLLLDRGAKADGQAGQSISPLGRSVRCGTPAIRELLVNYVTDINEPSFIYTGERRTALMQAAAYDMVKVMGWLLDHGANVNGPDPTITTPLIEAAKGNSIEACRLLLQKGADARHTTSKGVTADKAAIGPLRHFIQQWPESRNWRKPTHMPMIRQ